MIISPAQQFQELTTAQKQKEGMKAMEDKKAAERSAQAKSQRDADNKSGGSNPVLPKETLGKKLDVTA